MPAPTKLPLSDRLRRLFERPQPALRGRSLRQCSRPTLTIIAAIIVLGGLVRLALTEQTAAGRGSGAVPVVSIEQVDAE